VFGMPKTKSIVFIAWKRLSRRTELLSEALGAKLLFFQGNFLYLSAAIATIKKIAKIKPHAVLVQLPQGPLLLLTLILKNFYGFRLIADVHTGFLMKWEWKSLLLNLPFKSLLKYCDVVVIHNEKMRNLLHDSANKKAMIVYDPWFMIKPLPQNFKEKYIVFPASYHPDEPLEEVLGAVKELSPDVKLLVTGDWRRRSYLKKFESKNILFTGFLSKEKFESLIANSSGIITGTKEEFTTLMSAWEAVAYTKPLAVNVTQTIRECYDSYPVFYDWKDKKSITKAIQDVLSSSPKEFSRKNLMRMTIKSVNNIIEYINTL